jgi:hypothetical protein
LILITLKTLLIFKNILIPFFWTDVFVKKMFSEDGRADTGHRFWNASDSDLLAPANGQPSHQVYVLFAASWSRPSEKVCFLCMSRSICGIVVSSPSVDFMYLEIKKCFVPSNKI